jgi:hypothetical protein
MTLYDSVIQYETDKCMAVLVEAAKKDMLLKISLKLMGQSAVNGDIEKKRFLLDKAIGLQGGQLNEGDLDDLVEGLGRIDETYTGLNPNEVLGTPDVISARKTWTKAVVGFYQQIMKQEGASETFEEAVRTEFGNPTTYHVALLPIIEAEERLYAAISEAMPMLTASNDNALKAATKVREYAIGNLFPKQLEG